MNKMLKAKAVRLQLKQRPKKSIKSTASKSGQNKMKTSVPVSYGNKITKAPPSVRSIPNGVCITNTEYIGDIASTAVYTATQYSIQPGNASVFPWLSNMAQLYETYTFDKLKFHYKTQSGTNIRGTVAMAIDYDANDAAPFNKGTIMNYSKTVRVQPWDNMTHTSLVSDLKKVATRFVNFGVIPVNADIKLYNTGNLYVATQGTPLPSEAVGELYVEYTIRFQTPQLDPITYASIASNSSSGTVGITGVRLLGTSPTLNLSGSGMPITYDTVTGAIGFLSTGTFLMVFNITNATISTGTVTFAMTNGSLVSTQAVVLAATLTSITCTVKVLNVGDALTISGFTINGGTFSSLRIASYPFGL